jgi:hypothetical protein
MLLFSSPPSGGTQREPSAPAKRAVGSLLREAHPPVRPAPTSQETYFLSWTEAMAITPAHTAPSAAHTAPSAAPAPASQLTCFSADASYTAQRPGITPEKSIAASKTFSFLESQEETSRYNPDTKSSPNTARRRAPGPGGVVVAGGGGTTAQEYLRVHGRPGFIEHPFGKAFASCCGVNLAGGVAGGWWRALAAAAVGASTPKPQARDDPPHPDHNFPEGSPGLQNRRRLPDPGCNL